MEAPGPRNPALSYRADVRFRANVGLGWTVLGFKGLGMGFEGFFKDFRVRV